MEVVKVKVWEDDLSCQYLGLEAFSGKLKVSRVVPWSKKAIDFLNNSVFSRLMHLWDEYQRCLLPNKLEVPRKLFMELLFDLELATLMVEVSDPGLAKTIVVLISDWIEASVGGQPTWFLLDICLKSGLASQAAFPYNM